MRGFFLVLCGLLLCRGVAGQSNRYEIPKESVHVSPSFTRINEETKKPEIVIKVRFELRALAGAALSEDMKDMVVITEDGKEVKRIALKEVRARDLTTMLVMDVSGSMARKSSSGKTKMQEAQAAARNFLQRLPARADSGLILFDHRIQPGNVHPPCGDRERVQEQRRMLSDLIDRAQPEGGTAYLDATHQALVILAKHLSGDKAVILMTDGIDLNSKKTAAKVVEFANEVGIPVYILGVGDPDWGEPVSSVLVLDHSGSMAAKTADDRKTKIEALHDAASRFVDLMREGAQATLLPFSSEVERPGPFSEDKAQLKKRILQLKPSGGTSLFDATYAGIETVVSTRPKGKRHVIVLTDGVDEDPGSRHGPDEVIDLAKAEGVSLYMLGLGSKEDINEAVMRKMADATGGRYDRADNQEELFKIFERLSIDLHGDGIDEKALRELAVKTGGRYYPVRDASQLELIYGEVVRDLEKTYEVEFPSLRQRMDARVSAIDIFVEDQEGKRVSDVAESDSSRGGVVVAEFNAVVYLIMLALLLGLLWAPFGTAPGIHVTDLDETIVAVSSASGTGARAIVRLSGTNVLPILSNLFFSTELLERRRRRWESTLRLPDLHSPIPADLYLWVGPHSFTGQDVAELHVLSSPPLVELLVAQLLAQGARAAQPGELTMRGFLAGKLDLTRAEAVLGVIEAGNRAELKQALTQLAGGVTRPLQELREDLLNLLADVEAGLDFSDEDLQFVGEADLLKRLGKALALVTLVGKQVDQRGQAERPYRIVLAGRPNAGKSSLFNALTGGRALVSPEEGTTRDFLVQIIELNGAPVELVDTAGLRATSARIEAQAQELGRSQADEADLVLLCVPGAETLTAEEQQMLHCPPPAALLIGTKSDRGRVPPDRFATSAVTGLGLEPLLRELEQRARSWARPALAPSLSRCRHHVSACLEHLRRAHGGVLHGESPELLAMELRGALDQLGEIVGAVYTDDLLDRIFSRFCIGK